MKLIYLYTLMFFIASCGSRKVQIEKQEKQVETQIEEKTITTDSSNVEIKFDYESENYIIEAKDNLKPFEYNGKTYFNVVLRHEKVKDNSLYKKDVKVSKIEDKAAEAQRKRTAKALTEAAEGIKASIRKAAAAMRELQGRLPELHQ